MNALDLAVSDFADAVAPLGDPDAEMVGVELTPTPAVAWLRESPDGLRLQRREPCSREHAELLEAAGVLVATWANSLPASLRRAVGTAPGFFGLYAHVNGDVALGFGDGRAFVELARRVVGVTTH